VPTQQNQLRRLRTGWLGWVVETAEIKVGLLHNADADNRSVLGLICVRRSMPLGQVLGILPASSDADPSATLALHRPRHRPAE
jgi:hypothetical protein